MPAQKTTPQRIVELALDLFGQHGYRGTSMNEVADACGIQKASLYHHFASKSDLLRAAVQHLISTFEAEVFQVAHASQYTPDERMQAMLEAIRVYGIERHYGTLLVCLSAEASGDVPELRALLHSFFDTWQQAFAHLFLEAGHMQPNRSALQSMCELQGALIVSSLQDRPELFTQATHHVLQRVGWQPNTNVGPAPGAVL